MRRILLLLVTASALAACEGPGAGLGEVAAPTAAEESPKLAASANAGPGSNALSVARARMVFEKMCVEAGPSFEEKVAPAAALGFVLNTRFGTFFHPTDNLSVKVVSEGCSMVFGSGASPEAVTKTLEGLAPGIRVRGTIAGGAVMYRALKT